MGTDVVVAGSIQAVGTVVTGILHTYATTRTVHRAELTALKDKISEARAQLGAQARGRLLRTNLEELAETQRLIDSLGFRGDSLSYAMDQLRLLHGELMRSFQEFSRG